MKLVTNNSKFNSLFSYSYAIFIETLNITSIYKDLTFSSEELSSCGKRHEEEKPNSGYIVFICCNMNEDS
jgi:hypothetical protein